MAGSFTYVRTFLENQEGTRGNEKCAALATAQEGQSDRRPIFLGALHCHLYDPLSLAYLVRRAGLELLSVTRIAEPSGKLSVYAFAAPAESVQKKGLPNE